MDMAFHMATQPREMFAEALMRKKEFIMDCSFNMELCAQDAFKVDFEFTQYNAVLTTKYTVLAKYCCDILVVLYSTDLFNILV